jgi:single-strand DNA-binding protein
MSVNKAIVLGRLGNDPDTRFTQSGDSVTRLSVATSSRWKDKATGEAKEETEWHRCVCFGRTAEIASQYLAKGREVYLEGHLKTRKWTDNSGIERYTTEIVVDQLTLIGGRTTTDPQAQTQAARPAPAKPEPRSPQPQHPSTPEFDDDIPF